MSSEKIAPFFYFSGTRIRSTNCHSSAQICVSIELNPFNGNLINTDDSQIGLANFKLEFSFVLCIVCVFVACEQHVHSSKGSDHTIHIRNTERFNLYLYSLVVSLVMAYGHRQVELSFNDCFDSKSSYSSM